MYCKNCGRQIPDQMKVCGYCGTPVEQQQVPPQEPADQQTSYREPIAVQVPMAHKKKSMILPVVLSCLAVVLLTGALLFAFRDKLFHGKQEQTSGHLIEALQKPPQQPEGDRPIPESDSPVVEEAPVNQQPIASESEKWKMDPFVLPPYILEHVNMHAELASYLGNYEGSTSYEVKGREALVEALGEEDAESLLLLDGMDFYTTAVLDGEELTLCFPDVSDDERAYWFDVNNLKKGVCDYTEEYTDGGFDNYTSEQVWFMDDDSLYGYGAQLLLSEGEVVGGIVMRVDLLPVSGVRDSVPPAETPEASQLETQEEPTWEEFSWYEQVRANGLGPNAQLTTDFNDMTGWWKACQIADPDRTQGTYSRELMSLEVIGSERAVDFIMHPYVIYWEDNSSSDSSEWGPYLWSGAYENGEFYLTGAGNIRLSQVWFLDGREFALGTVTFQDGTTGELALMRP